MQQFVKASVFDFKLTWMSQHYISKYSSFHLKCKTLEKDLGILKDTYHLSLTGSEEDIHSFLCYLRMEGFKVETY